MPFEAMNESSVVLGLCKPAAMLGNFSMMKQRVCSMAPCRLVHVRLPAAWLQSAEGPFRICLRQASSIPDPDRSSLAEERFAGLVFGHSSHLCCDRAFRDSSKCRPSFFRVAE